MRSRILAGAITALAASVLIVPTAAMAHDECEEGTVGPAVHLVAEVVGLASDQAAEPVHEVEDQTCGIDS